MPGFIDTVVESLKQSLDWPLWLYFFAVQIIEGIVSGVVVLLFLFVGAVMLLGSFSLTIFQNPAAFFSNPANLLGLFTAVGILVAILIVILTFVASYFTGIRFNLFNNFLKTKKIDLGKAFEDTTPRAFTYFKVSLLVSLIGILILLILAIPVFSSIPALLGMTSPAPLIGFILYVVVVLLLFALGVFLLSPILQLLAPAAFFERKGAVDTLKRAIELAKANYLGNLAFVLIFMVVVMGISWILSIILQFVSIFTLIPAIALSESGGTIAGAAAGGFVVYGVIYVILFVPYIIWSTVFETAAFRNLYYLDQGLLRPKAKGKKRKRK
jgi:hypothetical protein